jgi:hypothetical protein
MANDRPESGDFLQMAQRMLRELFSDLRSADEPWAEATRRARESFAAEHHDADRGDREPSPEQQRENLTFALATRAVEALEDLVLNVAAIRQRLERTGTQAQGVRPETEGPRRDRDDATGEQPPPDRA